MTITGRTQLVFLAGDPIDHAKGFAEYADALAAAGIDAAYLPVHVPAGQLAPFLAGLRWAPQPRRRRRHRPAQGGGAHPRPPRRSRTPRRLRQPVTARPPTGWECSMVDGAGFLAAADAAGIAFAGKQVQLLGAGGAGRAVAMAIAERGPAALRHP